MRRGQYRGNANNSAAFVDPTPPDVRLRLANRRLSVSDLQRDSTAVEVRSPGRAEPANDEPKSPSSSRRRSVLALNQSQMGALTQVAQGQNRGARLNADNAPKEQFRGSMLLPPQAGSSKPCLVLDLDETLVHSQRKPCSEPAGSDFFDISFRFSTSTFHMRVSKRPGCDDFLRQAAEDYELVIFTASVAPYCQAVMEKLDPDKLVSHQLYREHCSYVPCGPCGDMIYVKDLLRLSRDASSTIILDNNPDCYFFQPQNAIPINSWYSDDSDRDLEETLNLLRIINNYGHENSVWALGSMARQMGWTRGRCDVE